MRDDVARIVQPLIVHGLQLKERLQHGELPDIDLEQSELKRLLRTENDVRAAVEFLGESKGTDSSSGVTGMPSLGNVSQRRDDQYLGIRYALACWLDEIFIRDSAWEREWNPRKLETALYGTNERARKFWQQEEKSAKRSTIDALEVFFVTVMLGFRGDHEALLANRVEYRDRADRLRLWAEKVQKTITAQLSKGKPTPEELEPPTNAPLRFGRGKFRQMVVYCGSVIVLEILALALLIAWKYS